KEMVDVAEIACRNRDDTGIERRAVGRRQPPSFIRPLGQSWQLGPQDGGLDLVKTGIHPGVFMTISFSLTAVPQLSYAGSNVGIARHDGSRVSQGTQVLGRVEAEGAAHSNRPDRTHFRRREVRLRTVFDQRYSTIEGDRRNRSQIRGLSVQMNRDDGPRSRS